MVWDLTDNRSLFCCNHRQLLRPASTMKLLTAITALDQLGTDYQFSTALYHTGIISDGVLHGDLYCVGGMDPLFDYADMDSLVLAMQQMGIRRIIGRVVADTSMKDTLCWGEGWCWDDDNPILSPLLVGKKADFMTVFMAKLNRAGIIHDGTIVEGNAIPANKPTRSLSKRSKAGKSPRRSAAPSSPLPSQARLVTMRCHSLGDVLYTMMKESDNLFAESMFYNLATVGGNRPARAVDATRQERALIERCGLDASQYRLADGSGLSLYNYLSAELEVALLRYAYQRIDIYDKLIPSLPIAGNDGTLKKRMKGTLAENNVQAKTGTLTGVISLAGYLTAANGHRLCFSIMNQGTLKASDARSFQDKICTILCEP